MECRMPPEEVRRRLDRAREELAARGLVGAYLANPATVFYYSGFAMVSTERPAALLLPITGDPGFVGPRLEEEHVAAEGGCISLVRTYFDYPGEHHPMEAIADFLTEMGMGKDRIGTDDPSGYARRFGYRGPRLCDLLPRVEFVDMGDFFANVRTIKSDEEIRAIREACRWADRALECLVAETRPGVWDVEAALAATLAATREMKAALGPDYRQSVPGDAPVSAGYRGQVGPASAFPHSFASARPFQEGDVLGSGATAEVNGYRCELERTFVLGRPGDEPRRLFEIMVRAQEAAVAALRPGTRCGEADLASWAVLAEAGVADRALHHTGHGIGLDSHEPPFLDRGEEEVLAPGMVFAVEPGIYVPGLGGFRHSDTVLVTAEGPERLTRFPRDLEACTLPLRRAGRKAAKTSAAKKRSGAASKPPGARGARKGK